jgi:energy-coupling factor transporter ATP-binding protein EcfA2
MIVFDRASYTYPGTDVPALDAVSFQVAVGEILAVVGANGSGKSTLARLANGLLSPASGTVTVDGLDVADEESVWDVRSKVGMVLQDPDDQIVGTMVEEDVAFGPENLGVPAGELRERITSALAAGGRTRRGGTSSRRGRSSVSPSPEPSP